MPKKPKKKAEPKLTQEDYKKLAELFMLLMEMDRKNKRNEKELVILK